MDGKVFVFSGILHHLSCLPYIQQQNLLGKLNPLQIHQALLKITKTFSTEQESLSILSYLSRFHQIVTNLRMINHIRHPLTFYCIYVRHL